MTLNPKNREWIAPKWLEVNLENLSMIFSTERTFLTI